MLLQNTMALERSLTTYNQFEFNQNQNFVQGFHYSIVKRNFNLYGESSRSNNGGLANLRIDGLFTSKSRLSIFTEIMKKLPNYLCQCW